jgi:hypothetical protein
VRNVIKCDKLASGWRQQINLAKSVAVTGIVTKCHNVKRAFDDNAVKISAIRGLYSGDFPSSH